MPDFKPIYKQLEQVGYFIPTDASDLVEEAIRANILQPAEELMTTERFRELAKDVYVRAILSTKFELSYCFWEMIIYRKRKKDKPNFKAEHYTDFALKELKARAEFDPFAKLVKETLLHNGDLKAGAKMVLDRGLSLGFKIPGGFTEADVLPLFEEMLKELQ